MSTLLTVLIILVSVLLILAVLVQNPKGGGLSSSFGGGAQMLGGVKKTTDFLDRATWSLAIALVVLVLLTNLTATSGVAAEDLPESEITEQLDNAAAPMPAAPAQSAPADMPEPVGEQP